MAYPEKEPDIFIWLGHVIPNLTIAAHFCFVKMRAIWIVVRILPAVATPCFVVTIPGKRTNSSRKETLNQRLADSQQRLTEEPSECRLLEVPIGSPVSLQSRVFLK